MKKIIITILVFVVTAGALAIRYAWIRSWGTILTSDGQPVTGVRVYRNWSGDVLVDLRSVADDLYVVRRSSMVVGTPNASAIKEIPTFMVATEHPLRIVDLRTAKGGGVDPQLVVTSEEVSFRTAGGKTIHLTRR